MRIENLNSAGVSNSGSSNGIGSVGAENRASNTEADASSSDSVRLSGASSLVALAQSATSSDRQSRIGSLAAQFQSGRYHVDAQQVSQAILESL